MKKAFLLLLLFICLSFAVPASGEEEFYTEMPPLLIFTQNTQTETITENHSVMRTYPDTASEQLDQQMRKLIDGMAENNRSLLALQAPSSSAYLDVGAVVSRTGTSVLSFLTLAEVSSDSKHQYVDYQTRVYDLETETELTLCDFFVPDSAAWSYLSAAVRDQLSAAFPALTPDQDALNQLCTEENLMQAPFTLGAARLTLTYRADTIYPGKNTLLHVQVYYPEIRHWMTTYGQAQTDNSHFRMIALTYDDGPARSSTRKVLNTLRIHGAQATFFVVGRNLARNHDMICRQQNSGYSIQSHSYTHIYPRELTTKEIFAEDERLRRELSEITGLEPTMMRAPGGMYPYYIRRKLGYPMINWSVASGDSGNDNVRGIIYRLQKRAEDNAIVLMHDINTKCHAYSEAFLDYLNENGYLCVTVEELFSSAGVALEPDTLYYSPTHIGE